MQQIESSLNILSLAHTSYTTQVRFEGKLVDKPSDESVSQVYQSMLPYITTQETLVTYQKWHYGRYYKYMPMGLFTDDEAKKIAELVATIFCQTKPVGDVYLPRKPYGISWKCMVMHAGCVVLLPKKNLFPLLSGLDKCGRIALECIWQGSACKTGRIWNLKQLPERSRFFVARATEAELCKKVGPGMFPKKVYDSQVVGSRGELRSCYYELLRCLAFWLDASKTAATLQKIASSAAGHICTLHNAQFLVRDIKPENMLVTDDLQVRLCDVDGIMSYDAAQNDKHVVSTVEFWSPQVWSKNGIIDCYEDEVFAFGCTLLEILRVGLPWNGDTPYEIRLDATCLERYKAHGEMAGFAFNMGDAFSIPQMLFTLAKWAMHPAAHRRPGMNKICEILAKSYAAEPALQQADVDNYMKSAK